MRPSWPKMGTIKPNGGITWFPASTSAPNGGITLFLEPMLTQLSIRNIVLIEACEIALKRGLCVLSGETGAGKSILLDALGLALGSRADSSLVRMGETTGSVTAEFDISTNDAAKA